MAGIIAGDSSDLTALSVVYTGSDTSAFVTVGRVPAVDLYVDAWRRASYAWCDRSRPEAVMARTRVSSKYQVVIPKDVRQSADIRVGQEFQVIAKGGQITLVPDRPIASMRGFVRGMKTTGFREKKDRL